MVHPAVCAFRVDVFRDGCFGIVRFEIVCFDMLRFESRSDAIP